MYDVGSDLLKGAQDFLSRRSVEPQQPAQPSINPEYDEFSDIQRDLSKPKYTGE